MNNEPTSSQPPAATATPLTDAAIKEVDVAFIGHDGLSSSPEKYVEPNFARDLERQLAESKRAFAIQQKNYIQLCSAIVGDGTFVGDIDPFEMAKQSRTQLAAKSAECKRLRECLATAFKFIDLATYETSDLGREVGIVEGVDLFELGPVSHTELEQARAALLPAREELKIQDEANEILTRDLATAIKERDYAQKHGSLNAKEACELEDRLTVAIRERDEAREELQQQGQQCDWTLEANQKHLADLVAAWKELDELQAWKKSAMSVMPDYQKLAELLNMPLGSSVSEQLVPAVERLIKERDYSRSLAKALNEDLHAATTAREAAERELVEATELAKSHHRSWDFENARVLELRKERDASDQRARDAVAALTECKATIRSLLLCGITPESRAMAQRVLNE